MIILLGLLGVEIKCVIGMDTKLSRFMALSWSMHRVRGLRQLEDFLECLIPTSGVVTPV